MSTYDSQTGRLAPQVLLQQRYMITGQAGRGGMGAVYEAMDTRFNGRRVAVKEMSQGHLNSQEMANATAQFQQEARLLGSLSHPNLPRIFDAFNERGRSYLVMDFIDGKTLHQVLRAQPGKTLALEQVIQYAMQLCNVLYYLHRQRPAIIFRDVKPSNVMITDKGHLYLIDFGIARFFTEGKEQDTMQLGSPGYAPPEQHGSSQTNPRSDIYSLGATLHYCLTGKDPYYSQEHFKFVPVRQVNPQVPVEMERLIQRMVSIDESQRPASADEVIQALRSLSQMAADHTVAIQADHGAPTIYGPPSQAAATRYAHPSQPVTPYPPIPTMPASPFPQGQQQVMAPGSQAIPGPASFWSAGFAAMFRLVALIGVGIVVVGVGWIVVQNTFPPYHYYYGYLWLLAACLTGVACAITFASFLWCRLGLTWFLLLFTGFFTLVSAFCSLALSLPDIQSVLGLQNALLDLAFAAPLSLALAALCSLGWMFSAGFWKVRVLSLSLSAIALVCAFSAVNTVSRVNPLDQEVVLWYVFFLVGALAHLLNTLLIARLSNRSVAPQLHTGVGLSARIN
jgi:tRNA A-37 threonylcarbamoyl transferase component Bud32